MSLNGNDNYRPRSHRLRNAFLLVSVIGFTCLVAAFISSIRHLEQNHIEEMLRDEFRIVNAGVSTQVHDTEKLLAAVSDILCQNSKTQAIWLSGDRSQLRIHIAPLYKQLLETAGITHLYFHTVDGTSFLRAHRPAKFGDKINRQTLQESQKTGKVSFGVELGPFGELTYRYVRPWYVDGELVGYVELGKEIDSIYKETTELLAGSSALLLSKKNLDEENWKKGIESLHRSADWDRYENYVVISQYPPGKPLDFIHDLLEKQSKTGQLPTEIYGESDGKTIQIGAIPIKDTQNRPVGYFAFEQDVTMYLAETKYFVKLLVVSTIVVAVLIAFLGSWFLSKVERQFNREHERVEEQLAFEYLQSNIIARFVDYEPQKWESLITQSLENVCEFNHASAVYTIGYSEAQKKLSDIYGWSVTHGDKAKTLFETVKFEEASWWIAMLKKGEPIVITGDTIMPEADVPQKLYALFQTKSLLAVPMFYSGSVRGCLMISHRNKPMYWQPKQINCMKSIANILATAIVRHQVEVSVRQYTEQLAKSNIHLKLARAEAEETARAKSEFLANMSHEIRTPMTAILGFAENMIVPEISDEDRLEAADTIYRNGMHLLQLINDILDFSKVEAGQIHMETISCPPVRIINDVISLMSKKAEEKGIFLKSTFHGAMPEECESDPTRLRQILLNLIGNAVKFTDHGGVTLFTGMEKNEEGQDFFVCEVNDTGIGMDEQQLRQVFEPFTQADNSVTRRYGGTGLGLAISRRITQAMGGTLTVESTQNVSTTFRLAIPVTIPEDVKWIEDPTHYKWIPTVKPAEKTAAEQAGKMPYRILLAEDGVDNQRLISLLLRKEGATVQIANNGSEAIRAIEEADIRGEPFDMVLMDMQMPVLDGYTATRRLRQAGFHLPIIALTASVMPEDRNRCLAAGCDDYASKPINRETLFKTIQTVVEKMLLANALE